MDHKSLWKKLKAELNLIIEFHKSGEMQSMAEAIHCEGKCQEVLTSMNNLESSQIAKNRKL